MQFTTPATWDLSTGPLVFDAHYTQLTIRPDGDTLTSSIVWRYELHLSLNLEDPPATKGKVEVVDKFTFPPSRLLYSTFDILDTQPNRFMFQDGIHPSSGSSVGDSKPPRATLAEYTVPDPVIDANNAGLGKEAREALITTILLHPDTRHKWRYCTFSGRVVQLARCQSNEDGETDDANADAVVPHELVLYDFLN